MSKPSNTSDGRLPSEDNARRTKAFLDGTSDPVTVVDREGRLTYLNQAASEFFGAPAATLLGQQAFDFIHPEDRETTQQAFAGWLKGRLTSVSWENRQVSLQGLVHHALWTIMPQYDAQGNLQEIWSIARDITAAKEYAARLETTIESSLDGYWLVDQEGRLLEVNDAYLRMSGYAREEILSLHISDLEAREESAETAARLRKLLAEGGDRFESVHRRKNGELFHVEVSTSLLPGPEPRLVAFLRDISDRKRLEEVSAQELSILQSVLDGIDDVIYVADPQTYELLHVNETFRRIWGDDTLGKPCFRVIQGRETPCPFCTNHLIFGEYLGRSYIWEFQNEVNGNWYRCFDRAIDWPDGRQVRFEQAMDITVAKRALETLRASEVRYRSFVELTGQLSWVTNPAGEVVEDLPAFRQFTGLPPAELYGAGWWGKAVHPEDQERTLAAWEQAVATGRNFEIECRLRRHDGVFRDFLVLGAPVLDDDNQVQEWVGTCIDISERKERETELKVKDAFFEGSTAALSTTDAAGVINLVNDAFVRMWGFASKEDAVGRSLHELFRYPAEAAAMLESLDTLGVWEGRFLARRREGEEFYSHGYTTMVHDAAGKITGYQSTNVDVTKARENERRLSELAKALQASQDNLEQEVLARTRELQRRSTELTTIMDALPGLVFYKDTENRYIRVNQYVADAHHATKEEIEGRDCFDLYPRDRAQAYLDDDLAVVRSGEPKLNIVEPWETEAGRRWITTSKIPYVDDSGAIVGVIGVSMDITERKEAAEALERTSRVTAAVNRIFQESLSADSEEALAEKTLRAVEELTAAKFGFIGEINPEGKLDTIALSNPGWQACAMDGAIAPLLIKGMELRGLWYGVLKNTASLIANDPAGHPDWRAVPPGHPELVNFLGVPFVREGRARGLIAVANKEGGFDANDREAAETLAQAFYEILLRKRLEAQVLAQARIREAQAELAVRLLDDPPVATLCREIISFLCQRLAAPIGLMYVAEAGGVLRLAGSHAHQRRPGRTYEYGPGEGLVGQVALEKKLFVLDQVPPEYFAIASGLGEMTPRVVYIKPIVHNGRVRAVLELGFLAPPDQAGAALLEAVNDNIAAAIESAQAREIQANLLEESQQMTEELQANEEELRASNEELEEQTQLLRDSEARLKMQQEELQVTNEELEEKTELLERQKQGMERARQEIMDKAADLARASRYKSEFLSNMSHELRTPLNSLLLLARSLSENREGNLKPEQVESAQVIYQGGNDLLSLINDILDLSKIEAGRMDLHFSEVLVADLAETVRRNFGRQAQEKGLALEVVTEPGAPERIISERKRVEQVLRNLVGNALKFTEEGHVKLTFGLAPEDQLRIVVEDTGIGVPQAQHKAIFEAFQQGDGSTGRLYGGTGLGLSIVKQLLQLLGGDIALASEPGQGSTFTVVLPINRPPAAAEPAAEPTAPAEPEAPPALPPARLEVLDDDRDHLTAQDRSILIVEDDARFARILARQCREQGFRVLASATGEAGLELARRHVPHGIVLDLKLPGMDGWRVLELLKEDPGTRHIPVHIASVEDAAPAALQKGAVGFLQKPVSREQINDALAKLAKTSERRIRRVLVVDDEESARRGIVELLAEEDVAVEEAASGAQALLALKGQHYDCMVLDLGLLDIDGGELLKQIAQDEGIQALPVIVHTARELTWEEDLELRSHAGAVVIKGVRSDERLLDEVSLFLHRVVAEMPEKKRRIITSLHDADAMLRGKNVLLVDDDMRALFAMTKILTEHGLRVRKAENGQKALALLETRPGVDIVLMDIMMPVLDGYETMKQIRAQEQFKKLPIVALTAKAMRGDYERCIEAGANDYLSKPVDPDRLISMLRVWLYR
ncbi:MAG: PAS domain S-box protein [Deltaproteobacteria bacterium]|nr:PAS domain S-box protein [Deltaproteobacteria bacterium]